jgi:hypothetical protein
MNTSVYDAEYRAGQPGWFWFGLTAAVAAWALNLCTNYIISGLICVVRDGAIVAASVASRGLLVLVTLTLLIVAVAAGLASYRNWRRMSASAVLLDAEAREWREFIAFSGILLSAALVVGLLWSSIPLILVNICVRAH